MTDRTAKHINRNSLLSGITHIFFEIIFYIGMFISMFFNYQIVASIRKLILILAIISLFMGFGSLLLIIWIGILIWSAVLLLISLVKV